MQKLNFIRLTGPEQQGIQPIAPHQGFTRITIHILTAALLWQCVLDRCLEKYCLPPPTLLWQCIKRRMFVSFAFVNLAESIERPGKQQRPVIARLASLCHIHMHVFQLLKETRYQSAIGYRSVF
jgi:hypothetical protein